MDKLLMHEKLLKDYACFDKDAVRLNDEDCDIRGEYFRDSDRIIYSKSYLRYMDKTQVFTNKENDHISRRMSHVQMVSKIARTIGRALSLNEDLIEAIALGHDLGHVPYGHLGESFLNEISLENGQGVFMHNVESVRDLMVLEHNGKGLNLTIQVLDGILCHNGELVLDKYSPVSKDKDKFLSGCITTQYVPYHEKMTDCEMVIVSTTKMENEFRINSPMRFMLFVTTLLSRYTEIGEDEDVLTVFETLDENDLIDKIIYLWFFSPN